MSMAEFYVQEEIKAQRAENIEWARSPDRYSFYSEVPRPTNIYKEDVTE